MNRLRQKANKDNDEAAHQSGLQNLRRAVHFLRTGRVPTRRSGWRYRDRDPAIFWYTVGICCLLIFSLVFTLIAINATRVAIEQRIWVLLAAATIGLGTTIALLAMAVRRARAIGKRDGGDQ